ncbi:MAG: hemerythrin family protein [Chlorobi bacterium]|nr:hemerythrin family protein [Chlorobiota bacterium]
MGKEIKMLEWKPEYEVGVQVIDENHRKFVEMVNHFVEMMNNRSYLHEHTEVFYSLIHYAEHYLIREEILFKDLEYPNLSQHKEKHSRFIEKIKSFQQNHVSDDPVICEEMYAFLINWFNEHILQYDREVSGFLKEKGLP